MMSPVGCADDMALRQQKMFQQRQILLKRQREFCKNSLGVMAQHDAALAPTIRKQVASEWGEFLQTGLGAGACCVEKVSLADSSSLVTVVVPAATPDESVERRGAFSNLPACVNLGAGLHHRNCPGVESTPLDKPSGAARFSSTPIGKERPAPLARHPETPPRQGSKQTPAVANCWNPEGPSEESQGNQEKPRGRKLWRPWGASKRAHVATELAHESIQAIQEEARVSISVDALARSLDRPNLVPLCRASTPWQPTTEDARGSVNFATDASEHCRDRAGSLPMCRAATPWQDCTDDPLDASGGSDLSSILGFLEEDQKLWDDAIETSYETSSEKALDDSGDSGIECMLSQWKAEEETQSPSKSRFERLKGLLPTKLRREAEVSMSVSQTLVQPLALDLD